MSTTDVKSFKLELSADALVFQGFLRKIKEYWGNELYDEVTKHAVAVHAADTGELHEALRRSSEAYRFFSWIERRLQTFKYSGRYGLVREFERQTDEAEVALEKYAEDGPGALRLTPQLERPDYYENTDFHHHRGGIWSDDIDAFAYEEGARTPFSVALGKERELHERLADLIATFDPSDVVDVGCGFGKTTSCIKEALPVVRVLGVDLAAPMLRLGHLRGVEQGLDIAYLQGNAESLPIDDNTVDIVTSTMLVHELPPDAFRRVLREARRILRPAGHIVFLDFYCIPGGKVGRFLIEGHSRRNNEPFLRELVALNLQQELEDAGFVDIEIRPFEEEEGALVNGDDLPKSWRFPWTTIVAGAPEGTS